MQSRLSALQTVILRVLAAVDPAPVVTGGAALIAFYTGHRTTRDVDAFWRRLEQLGELPRIVEDRLRDAGLETRTLQSTRAFARIRVASGDEVCLLDLVAEPVAALEPPEVHDVGGTAVLADSAHEILVNKLCTLLERAEVRDLLDVMVLIDRGGDLERALHEAPRKDGGFSPLTLAWVLETTPFEQLAADGDVDEALKTRLSAFRARLVGRLTERSAGA